MTALPIERCRPDPAHLDRLGTVKSRCARCLKTSASTPCHFEHSLWGPRASGRGLPSHASRQHPPTPRRPPLAPAEGMRVTPCGMNTAFVRNTVNMRCERAECVLPSRGLETLAVELRSPVSSASASLVLPPGPVRKGLFTFRGLHTHHSPAPCSCTLMIVSSLLRRAKDLEGHRQSHVGRRFRTWSICC